MRNTHMKKIHKNTKLEIMIYEKSTTKVKNVQAKQYEKNLQKYQSSF